MTEQYWLQLKHTGWYKVSKEEYLAAEGMAARRSMDGEMPSATFAGSLVDGTIVQGKTALPYPTPDMDIAVALKMATESDIDTAMNVVEAVKDGLVAWLSRLKRVLHEEATNARLAGYIAGAKKRSGQIQLLDSLIQELHSEAS